MFFRAWTLVQLVKPVEDMEDSLVQYATVARNQSTGTTSPLNL